MTPMNGPMTRAIVDLIKRVVTVSVETVKIVDELPSLKTEGG